MDWQEIISSVASIFLCGASGAGAGFLIYRKQNKALKDHEVTNADLDNRLKRQAVQNGEIDISSRLVEMIRTLMDSRFKETAGKSEEIKGQNVTLIEQGDEIKELIETTNRTQALILRQLQTQAEEQKKHTEELKRHADDIRAHSEELRNLVEFSNGKYKTFLAERGKS